jgi:WD40 repeat protein
VFAWDLSGGRELLAARQDGECWAVAVSPDGRLLVTGDGAEVVRIDLVSGERTRLASLADKVCGLGISPDGTIVVAGGWDGSVSAFETRTGQQRWRLAFLAKCLRFSPDGRLLALAGAGVVLVDPADGSVRRRLVGRVSIGTYQHLAWSPDGGTVAIASEGPRGQRLSVWRWEDAGEKPRSLRLPGAENQLRDAVCDLAFSPGGAVLASAHAEGDIHLWNTESGEHRLRLRGRQDSMEAVVFVDEGRLAAAGRDVDRGPPVYVWDL